MERFVFFKVTDRGATRFASTDPVSAEAAYMAASAASPHVKLERVERGQCQQTSTNRSPSTASSLRR